MRTAPRKNGGTLRGTLLVAAVTFLIYVFIGVQYIPITVIGDELDYYATLYGWAMHGSSTLTPAVVESVRNAFPGRPESEPRVVHAIDGTDDAEHFWFISFLSTPFFWLSQAFGLNWTYSFTFLNGLLFALALGVAYRKFSAWGAVIVMTGTLSSPLLAYLNRAHSEVFAVSLLAVAGLYLQAGEMLAAAIALSVISAQISAFSPIALGLVLLKLKDFRTMRFIEWAGVGGCFFLLALQPVWSLWRHHVVNVLINAGYVFLDMATPKRVATIIVDPDLGLIFTWPATLVIGAMLVYGICVNRRVVTAHGAYWGFAAAATLFLSFIAAQQENYTSAAPRYSLWFVPFLLVGLLVAVREVPSISKPIFLVAVALSAYYLAGVRGVAPSLVRSPLAEAWYRWVPGFYDPGEQTFVDLALHHQVVKGRVLFLTVRFPAEALPDPSIWAMSNRACSKVLVLAATFHSPSRPPRLPLGCEEPLDAARFLEFVQQQTGKAPVVRDRFVTVSSSALRQMRVSD